MYHFAGTHTKTQYICTCTPVHTYKHSHSLHLYMCVGRHILCSTEQCGHTYPVGISDSTPATSSCAAWVHISDTPHNWTWPPKNIAGCHNRQKEQLTTENHVCTQCSLPLFTTVTLEMPTHGSILLSQCQLCHRALGWSKRMSSEVFAILVLCESTSPSVKWRTSTEWTKNCGWFKWHCHATTNTFYNCTNLATYTASLNEAQNSSTRVMTKPCITRTVPLLTLAAYEWHSTLHYTTVTHRVPSTTFRGMLSIGHWLGIILCYVLAGRCTSFKQCQRI